MATESHETPFREPAPPEPNKIVVPSRRFADAYTRAQTEASVATARGWGHSIAALSVFGVAAYFILPSFLSHLRADSPPGACLCKAMPLSVLLFAALMIAVATILVSITKTKPARLTFKRAEDLVAKMRSFNAECRRTNNRILKFESATPRKKKEIVSAAMSLSKRRAEVLKEMEAYRA